MTHYAEDDLILYYYGEGRRRGDIERHLDACAACAATHRAISRTLALVAAPEPPERGEQYGLEVWQRVRHRLPDQDAPWWIAWLRWDRLAVVSAAAAVLVAAFVAGRVWPRQPASPASASTSASSGNTIDARQRILLASIADHLDRAERVLTDIMNVSDARDISAEQRWADDLLSTSRLY